MSEKSGESGISNLSETLEADTQRYINKGYGLIWAIIITLVYIVFIPYLFKTYLWQYLIDNYNNDELLYYGIYSAHVGGTIFM